ncbi:MAG TPA: alpha-L-fucosidase [Prolixibacteraceae bacterium]|jgi:alpha-L-fucosidase
MKAFTLIFLCLIATSLFAQNARPEAVTPKKMEWFEDAKLGIFIHYGIYAVNGISESWSFKNNQISYYDYMKQLQGFTAKKYDAQQWAMLFKEAGAKYAVLTSKHHDGVALWDTKLSDLSVVKKTPAARDLIAPYAKALRQEGLKVGIYFSHLDWSHPDYATVFSGTDKTHSNIDPFDNPKSGLEDQGRWNKFVDFRNGQLKELFDLVNPDLWWFDGDWTRTAEQWKMKELRQSLLSWNPNAILNARMSGYGDYATPEQGVPIFGPQGPWELCMTINDSWGFQKKDNNQKSVNYIIRVFADCISMGGNLLLDAGPMEDGTFTPEQTERLKGLGRWTNKHAEAIYGSRRGLPLGHFYGPTTLSKDRKTIYCFLLDIPKDDIVVKGIQNKVTNVRLVGTNETLVSKRNGGAEWMKIPGVLQITVPVSKLDQNVTVVAIDLDSPLELYRGSGGAIEQN